MKILYSFLLLSFSALAQSPYGRVTGIVTDSAGAVIPHAAVRVVNIETNVITPASSNETGFYEASDLNPGQYRVEVEQQGFKLFRRGPVEVRVMDVLDIPIRLEGQRLRNRDGFGGGPCARIHQRQRRPGDR
jgi:hypothetical protein